MKRNIFFICLMVLSLGLQAQSDSMATASRGSYAGGTGVTVRKDPRIDLLLKKQVETNEILTRNMRRNMAGYRILVINTPVRDRAIEAKTKMYQEFPELKSYLLFQSPKFHLKVGNFRTRAEADAYVESIKMHIKGGVYVVRDTIEIDPVAPSDSL